MKFITVFVVSHELKMNVLYHDWDVPKRLIFDKGGLPLWFTTLGGKYLLGTYPAQQKKNAFPTGNTFYQA